MKKLVEFLNESIILEASIDAKIIEEADFLYEFFSKLYTLLNSDWQNYIKNNFNEDIPVKTLINDAKENKISDYKGSRDREGFYNGGYYDVFKPYNFENHEKELADELNEYFKYSKNTIFEHYSCLFTAACRLYESKGWSDPMSEWSIRDFRVVECALYLALYKIATERKLLKIKEYN